MNHHLPAVLSSSVWKPEKPILFGPTGLWRLMRSSPNGHRASSFSLSGLQPFKRAAEKQFFIQLYLKTRVFEMRCPFQVLWGCKKPRQKFSLSNFSPGYLASTWGALFSCVRVWKRPQKDTPKTCLSNFILWLRDNMPFSPLVRDVSSDI